MRAMKWGYIVGVVAFAAVTGCQTTEDSERVETVAVQMIEMECDASLLEAAWSNQRYATDLQSLKTLELLEDPDQYVRIGHLNPANLIGAYESTDPNIRNPQEFYYSACPISTAVETLRGSPAVKVIELPTMYLAEGERAVDDDSELMDYPTDYEVVDGKTLLTKTDQIRIGRLVEVELREAAAYRVTVAVECYMGRVREISSFELSNGDEISMPYFETQQISAEYSLPYNAWISLGGLVIEPADGSDAEKKSEMLFLRVTRDNG